MTDAERVQAVADYGFTERQARFLVLVMRHAGLCVKRQYAACAGIAHGGEKCNAFFDRLVRRGYAVTADCIHNRAKLYHIHHRALYNAVGDADSRYRRAVPARSAAERLMRLDAALTGPDLDWLTTRSEKVEYLQTRAASHSPQVGNECPGTFPIGMDATGHMVVLYLATVPWTDDFRAFLIGHTALLRMAPSWTLRIVFPQPMRRVIDAYRAVVHEELESPLQAGAIHDLKRYFFHRRRGTDLSTIPESLRAFLKQCARAFGGAVSLTSTSDGWSKTMPLWNQFLPSLQRPLSLVARTSRARSWRTPTSISPPWSAFGECGVEDFPGRKSRGTLLRTASTRFLTRLLNPLRASAMNSLSRSSSAEPRHEHPAPARCCAIAPHDTGAAFCAAPDGGSDHFRNGTQDVNDPVSCPATRDGGVVHVLGSACRSR